MQKTTLQIFASCFFVSLWVGCLTTPAEDLSYQHMLDMIVVEGIPGAVLMVRTPDFQFVGASGYAEYGTGYGNGGHFVGYESGVMYFPDTDTTIVYFVNGTGPRLSRVMDDFLDLILEKALSEQEKTSQVFVAIPEVSCTMSKFHSGFIT